MSNNKQSSVEWYADQLDNLQYNPLEKNGYVNAKNRLLEQAKAIHKKQTIDFAEKAVSMVLNEDIQNPVSINQLYNETFGSQTTLEQEEQQ